MSVWVVVVNDHVDTVFDNEEAAKAFKKAKMKGWNIVYIYERRVISDLEIN